MVRKIKRILFDAYGLERILSGKMFRFNGIPKGAKVVNIGFDYTTNMIVIVVAHNSFKKVKDGEMIPLLDSVSATFFPDLK